MHARTLLGLLALTAMLGGCAALSSGSESGGPAPIARSGTISHAVAVLTPTDRNSVRGVVTFVQSGSLVTVTADINGLEPNSEHAWHIHEFGDLSSRDGSAAGSHYNPQGYSHGLPDQPMRHAGDFGNLNSDATGHARSVITVPDITVNGSLNPIIGRGVIIHAGSDDGGQPTGNAGGRIAQGVIGVAKGG